ncbi:MAG: response regulator [Methanophagales archaeon]|nr:response regulator [Methanophagales archaeon]
MRKVKTKNVMIVDDEPDVLDTIAQILVRNGYKIIKAKNGQECLDRLKEEIPDVILLDIMMPGLTAKEILKAIEKDSRLSRVKIIFLTAIHMPEAEEGGLLASKQVVDFIEKPFTIRRMIDAIEKAICCFQISRI